MTDRYYGDQMWDDRLDMPDDRHTQYATEAEAHVEWHLNSGVPMGTPGCPQDACHDEPDDYDDEPPYGSFPEESGAEDLRGAPYSEALREAGARTWVELATGPMPDPDPTDIPF